MKVQSVSVKGFRCFGECTKIRISDSVTALVGSNGSGKTAFLEALTRVFGITREQRTIKRNDFYSSPNDTTWDDRELFIDVRLSFPELIERENEEPHTIPHFFRHMVISKPGEVPFIRIRLEAKWINDNTLDGDIEQSLWWIRTDDEIPGDTDKEKCDSKERSWIQVHYIPAARDPSIQLKYATSSLVGRLLRAINWSEINKKLILNSSENIRSHFFSEAGIRAINKSLSKHWRSLHKDVIDAEPEFNLISRKFDEIVRSICVVFRPTETGGERDLEELSDGQKSLFYFSLISSVFDIEQQITRLALKPTSEEIFGESKDELHQEIGKGLYSDELSAVESGFKYEDISIPILTIFALEEPENHLSPYFLARIIRQIRELPDIYAAQAILTSHSAAILARIDPSEVRHLRLKRNDRTSVVNEIGLPKTAEQLAKYVRGAVHAYPELYFSKFVILGEGDSEQIVLPWLASALGFEIDRSFVAMVPLSGRHVNYFWKLLGNLKIPYATLLDFDLGR